MADSLIFYSFYGFILLLPVGFYLRRQMRLGVLRSADPFMAARSFIGAVVYHSLIQELFGPVDTTGNMDVHEASSLMVSIWLDGMSAETASRRTVAARSCQNSA